MSNWIEHVSICTRPRRVERKQRNASRCWFIVWLFHLAVFSLFSGRLKSCSLARLLMTYLARNNACYCRSTFFFWINDLIFLSRDFALSVSPEEPFVREYKRTGDNVEITDDCRWPSTLCFICWMTSTCWISAFSSIWYWLVIILDTFHQSLTLGTNHMLQF